MARPKKQTVDYFPHYCDHGKTIFILENMYKNDGFAFFYKLMECLGKSDGHVFDTRNPAEWEFLVAKTLVTEEMALAMLDKLSIIGVLDKELWDQKIIWMQSFVDSVSEAYKKRGAEIPSRPSFCDQKPTSPDVSGAENTQTKLNKIKDNKGYKEKSISRGESGAPEKDQPFESENQDEKKDLDPVDKKEIAISSPSRVQDHIHDVCRDLISSGKYPDAVTYVLKAHNQRINPRALLHALWRLKETKLKIDNPAKFLDKVIAIENGNYNELDNR